jgi:group I intron endonuclease
MRRQSGFQPPFARRFFIGDKRMYGIIYKATGPSGKVYVGQTKFTLAHRKGQHKFRAKKQDRRGAFQLALLEDGFDAFTWEQIDQAETREELDQKEKHWITHYDSMNPEKGYNNQSGGITTVYSPEARKKISAAHMGEKNNMFGKHHTLDARRKMSEAHKGKRPYVMTEKTRRKMSEAQKKRRKEQGTILGN